MNLSLSGSQISPNRRTPSRPSSAVSVGSGRSPNVRPKFSKKTEPSDQNTIPRLGNANVSNKISTKAIHNTTSRGNSKSQTFASPGLAIKFPNKSSRPTSARSTRSNAHNFPKPGNSTRSSKEYLELFNNENTKSYTRKSVDEFSNFSDKIWEDKQIKIPGMEIIDLDNNFEITPMNSVNFTEKESINKENKTPKTFAHPTVSEEPKLTNKLKNKTKIGKQKTNLEDREQSAVTIQKFYRRHIQRKKASSAALKRLLKCKREKIQQTIEDEQKSESHERKMDEDRKKRRQNQAKEARLKAIEELKRSREVQKVNEENIVEEEMNKIKERQTKTDERKKDKTIKINKTEAKEIVESVENKIEKIFEETAVKHEKLKQDGNDKDMEDIVPNADTEQNQSLLSSLLKTIEELEAEPDNFVRGDSSKFDEKLSWINDMQSDHLSVLSQGSKSSQNKKGAGDGSVAIVDENILLTKVKMDNIMNFLDNVEKQDLEYESTKSQVSINTTEETTKKFVESEQAASEIANELLKLRLETDEKNRSIELLKKALSQQKELTLRHIKSQDTEMEQRLKMQKEQYESTVQRHLAFINQLIDDKKELTSKCQKMIAEMKTIESKYQTKIKRLEETQQVELQKSKEVLTAAEKLRREKWINEKTQTIKEMTVKGLEPEIQRLIAKHKQEIKKIKAVHEAEILQSDERAAQRYIRQTEELREQLEKEKEDACIRERELVRKRFEKQLENEEMALQQQRRRLYAEVTEEKERLNIQHSKQRKDVDESKLQLEDANRRAIAALTEEYNKGREEAERRHTEEMEAMKNRIELEKQAWQENYMKKQETFIAQKERQFKEALRKDRDNDIETVIEQLEKDMRQQKEQIEKTSENRIKRIREKYEAELKEVEKMERQTQEKYNLSKAQFADIEGENMRLHSQIKQKDQELLDVQHIKNKLVEERGNVADVIRDEFAERLVYTEDENKRMKNELSQMRSRHKLEINRISGEKDEELNEVHKRVKAAIVKKEEAILQMKEQYEAAVKRSDHLEELLEQQRKQLLSIKKK